MKEAQSQSQSRAGAALIVLVALCPTPQPHCLDAFLNGEVASSRSYGEARRLQVARRRHGTQVL
jgi:hypothetical protein